jgi:signal transduction histidine kinase
MALVLGCGLTALYVATDSTVPKAVAYLGAGVLAVTGMASGALLSRAQSLHWWFIAGAIVLWIGGDALWEYDSLRGIETAYPSVADVLYLAGYPLLLFGLLLLIRGRGRPSLGELLDGAIIALGIGVLVWHAFLAPIATQQAPMLERTVSLLTPTMDGLIAIALLPLALSGGARNRSLQLLTGAFCFLLVADLVYSYQGLQGSYALGDWMDGGWTIFYTLLAVAALHPTAVRLRDRIVGARTHALTWTRFALMGAALVAAPAAAMMLDLTGSRVDGMVLGVAGIVATALGLARVYFLWRERDEAERAVRESEARFRSMFEDAESARTMLADHNDRLRELDQMKDEFIALVSHDLRTPLTSIRGYIELLLEGLGGELTDEQRRWMDVIDRNSSRLLRLVADLLFIAQLDAGKVALEPGEVRLEDVAAETVEAVLPTAQLRKVDLQIDVRSSASIEGDRARLGQLLDNLVSNALKFTPPGGRVEVRVGATVDGAWLEVADSGMGIAEEEQQHLFERFFRTASASSAAIQGTGLGLAIAQAIVHAHGGTIAVDSTEGVGTTFRIELPNRTPRTLPAKPTEVSA